MFKITKFFVGAAALLRRVYGMDTRLERPVFQVYWLLVISLVLSLGLFLSVSLHLDARSTTGTTIKVPVDTSLPTDRNNVS